MDAPPPRLAPRGPTLLTDLPEEVLAYILSLIPGLRDRFGRPPQACRALAAAARPPLEAWAAVEVPVGFLPTSADLGEWGDHPRRALVRAVRAAAPSVRALAVHVRWRARLHWWRPPTVSFVDAAVVAELTEPAAPHLHSLDLVTRPPLAESGRAFFTRPVDLASAGVSEDNAAPFSVAWLEPTLARAARLAHLCVGDLTVEAPPPAISAARAAIIAAANRPPGARAGGVKRSVAEALELHRGLAAGLDRAGTTAGLAGPTTIALTGLAPLRLGVGDRLAAAQFAAEAGAHLTRLGLVVDARPNDLPSDQDLEAVTDALISLVSHAPRLRALGIDSTCPQIDLMRVASPPTGLTSLVVGTPRRHVVGTGAPVLLQPAIQAGLECLAVPASYPEPGGFAHLPACLRGAGSAFARLTRLVYSLAWIDPVKVNYGTTNLGPWGRPEFALPTLVTLEVRGSFFTLDAPAVRGDWARTVATATLPRLRRLVLWAPCGGISPFRSCPGMTYIAVERTIVRQLPARAAEAGRRLVVRIAREVEGEACVDGLGWDGLFEPCTPLEMVFEAVG
jgi:hypothetical protein